MFESTPGYNDTFTVSGSTELSCQVLQRLHPGKWLDAWAITAAMHISDKPANVVYDVSIPLDEAMSNNQTRQIERPFARWARKIDKHKKYAKEALGSVPLVYFCPINHWNKHFTLLEINEEKRIICHYDSMAEPDIIGGIKENRLSQLVKEEFGGLGFSYLEAVSFYVFSVCCFEPG